MPGPRTHPRRKIVAIMAADVAGYSRLMGRDEEGTYSALRAHLDELFIPKIAEFEGRIIKFIGDGVLAEFPSAVDAMNCAATLQAQMAVRNRDIAEDRQLNFRIGLHVGDVMDADGDLFGDGVNTAARVEGTATPGGINVSRFVYESVRKKVTLEFEDLGEHMFKSFEEPVEVYRVHGFLRSRTELRLGEVRERIAPGTRLNGIYEVDTLLAVGSTSEIYRARSVQTGDPVVIKAIAPQLTKTPEAIDNVRSQASALYHLDHEAIASTFLCSLDEAIGQVYLAMEAVDGISLGDRVRHTPLTADEADVLRKRIAGALKEAHGAGVIHRAVTPDNIVLPEGDVTQSKLIDFTITGLRPDSERTVFSPGLDAANLFQAPEQLGHYGGQEGPATDAYGLGQVLAYALTGSNLQQFGTFAELVEGRKERPDVGPLPARLRPLVHAMLAPDPQRRLSDMAEIADWDWTRPLKVTRLPTPRDTAADAPQESEAEERKSRRGFALVAGVAAIAIVAGGAWYALTQTGGLSGGAQTAATTRPDGNPPSERRDGLEAPPTVATGEPGDGGASAAGNSEAGTLTAGREGATDGTGTAAGSNSAGTAATNNGAGTAPANAAAVAAGTGDPPTPQSAGAREPTFEAPTALRGAIRLAALDGRNQEPASVAGLLSVVDTLNAPQCFFASVDKASETNLFVDMYAQNAETIYTAYNALKAEVGFDPNVTGRLISDGQCVVLDFAGLGASTSAMGLTLADRSLPNGTPLDGTLSNIPGRRVLLLAIDPRGAVYDLSGALEPGPQGLRFVLNVNHPARGSITNLLLAVTVPDGVDAPAMPTGTLAKDYFPALAEALASGDQPVAIRLEHFVLRS